MSSITEALEALEAAADAVSAANWSGLPVRDRLEALDVLETAIRRQRAVSHSVIHGLDEAELGAPVAGTVADVLRISRAEARRRVRDAAQVAARVTLTGQSLPPELPATAAAWDQGVLDGEHLRTIQGFVRELPAHLASGVVAEAEAFLAEHAAVLRPDQLSKVAAQLALRLNPDGRFSDADRARQRGFTWSGQQRPDGMSVGRVVATGMCNPDDQTPTVTGEPTQDVVDRDVRGHAQRQHDALTALLRGQLGDPRLGQHNGLPVTVIVSTTLDQLQAVGGVAVTAGGSLLPIRDVIRMAAHAYHYLCVFDTHTERPLYLGRSKRIATADQRLVLHAKDRGCTAPGCDMPGYLAEVHHVDEWTSGGNTNIDRLTFACLPHHKLVKPGGWRTRKHPNGSTEWFPPPHLPISRGANTFHHPERMISRDDP